MDGGGEQRMGRICGCGFCCNVDGVDSGFGIERGGDGDVAAAVHLRLPARWRRDGESVDVVLVGADLGPEGGGLDGRDAARGGNRL